MDGGEGPAGAPVGGDDAGDLSGERFAQGHPLAEGDRDTDYAGHTEGYTDYPAFIAN
ncbi:hypothetical protein [Streptomyces sp. NPDC058249]|uniref:hypothetical protein n=1 Tax=Streptomyces sp. NPDC058249 TaxID=3346403 RepID=UPI0036F11D34